MAFHKIAVYLFIILHHVKTFVAIRQDMFLEDFFLADRVCKGDDTIHEVRSITKIKCGMFCERDHLCSGFTFRQSDGQCVLCQNQRGNESTVDIAIGTRYYVKRCKKYDSTFQRYAGHCVWGHNDNTVKDITLDACIDACLATTNPVCASIDYSYDYEGSSCCNMATVTALDVPSDFGAYAEWEHHRRDCQ